VTAGRHNDRLRFGSKRIFVRFIVSNRMPLHKRVHYPSREIDGFGLEGQVPRRLGASGPLCSLGRGPGRGFGATQPRRWAGWRVELAPAGPHKTIMLSPKARRRVFTCSLPERRFSKLVLEKE
jgi:hypothetical protein